MGEEVERLVHGGYGCRVVMWWVRVLVVEEGGEEMGFGEEGGEEMGFS